MRRVIGLSILAILAALLPAYPASAGFPPVTTYELSPSLVRIAMVDGVILDVNPTRLLYLDSAAPPMLNLVDRTDWTITTLPAVPNLNHEFGWLTPQGVVYTVNNPDYSDRRLLEWTGGDTATELGSLTPWGLPTVAVAGNHLAWSTGNAVYTRDLTTSVTVEVDQRPSDAVDVSANGDVVYAALEGTSVVVPAIWRFRNGTRTPISTDPSLASNAPVTDGVNVVYRNTPANEYYTRSTVLHNGTDTIELATPVPDAGPIRNYDVADGWTAWWGTGPNGGQIFLRSPAGVINQVSAQANPPDSPVGAVVAVSPTGEALYSVGDSLYRGLVGQKPTLLAKGVGEWFHQDDAVSKNLARYVDGQWLLGIGGSLFERTDQKLVDLPTTVTGHGTIGFDPYGAICQAECPLRFVPGTTIAVSAAPDNPGWRFDGWGGDCAEFGTSTCWLQVREGGSLQARFVAADVTGPITAAPVTSLVAGTPVMVMHPPSIPMFTSWRANDRESDVEAQELEVSVNQGGFAPVPLVGTNVDTGWLTGAATAEYQFRTRARDLSGNVGEWSVGAPFTLAAQSAAEASFEGSWHTDSPKDAWMGEIATPLEPWATATFWAAGEAVGIVARTDVNYGQLEVYVDDQLRQVVSTAYEGPSALRIVASLPLGGSGFHTIRVRAGTGPGPIELHGVVVLSSP